MSEKFGLNWKKHDAKRMFYVMKIMEIEAKSKNLKKNNQKHVSYGRKQS